MTSVRAAVMTAPGEVEVQRFPVPEPERGAVVMRVRLSGICGTDKHTYRGETIQYAGTPHERRLEFPLICGHENVGVVEALGGEVLAWDGTPLRPGDRIVPGANVPCGACWYCVSGQPYYLCEHLEDYGNSLNARRPPSLFGGWAELMYLLPGTPIFRVPDELPDELAVLTEVMAVTHGVEAARRVGGCSFGESVVVYGVGPLGLCHLIKSRLLGCGRLVAIDLLASRLETAAVLGATLTLDASLLDDGELVARVREHTRRGADVVHDCSGTPRTFGNALRMARAGGVVVESGAFVDLGPVEVNPNRDICAPNVSVLGIGGETAAAYAGSLELLTRNRDRLPLDRIVTHRMRLEDAATALELAQREGAMKVVLDPTLRAERRYTAL
ncbi:MAG TPA: alcohol dehydrogenase catalytic domain-containing protein [Gaiellaceae bacterium]|nr:alcohol dehydrogenase catalytic domain-containing protein [Gaiellaceae bacterium]